MEGEEKLMGGSLPEVGELIQSAEEQNTGTGGESPNGEANGWLIITFLEKAANSNEEVSPEDQPQKTLCEIGQNSSDAGENELPEGVTQVLPHPGEHHGLENTPDVEAECSGDKQGDLKQHEPSVLPVNSQQVDNTLNPDAPDTTVVEGVQLSGEATPDPSVTRQRHDGLNEGAAEEKGNRNGDEKEDLKWHDASELLVDPLEVDNIQKLDNQDTPVAEEIHLPGEATPTSSHSGEVQALNKTPAKAKGKPNGDKEDDVKLNDVSAVAVDALEVDNIENTYASDAPVANDVQLFGETDPSYKRKELDLNGKSSEDNADKMEPHDTLTNNSQEVVNIHDLDLNNDHQPEECEAEVPQMGYDSFLQQILECLNELKDSNNADTDQVSEDDGKEMHEPPHTSSIATGESGIGCPECLEYADYFEPSLFEIIVDDDISSESVSVLNDLDCESCSEDGSYLTLEMDNYERQLPDLEGTDEPPVAVTYIINSDSDGTLSTRGRRGTSSFQKDPHYSSVKLPTPDNLRGHRWVVANAHAFYLGTSGLSYIGGIADGQMYGFGRLMLGDSKQFLEGIWCMNRLVELHSCNLVCDPGNQTVLIIKRQNDHLLTMYENHYVARVIFDALEELDFTVGIAHLKRHFFKKLMVLELVADELEQKKRVSLNKFATVLTKTVGVDADSVVRANTFILLSVYLAMPDTDLSDILRERKLPVDVRDAAADLLDCEKRYLSNTYMFSNNAAKLRLDLRKVLQKTFNDGIVQHRQMLIDKCPSVLPNLLSSIRSLPESKIVYVTCDDIRIFDHVVSQPCFEHYKAFFTDLVNRFTLTIHNIKTRSAPSTVIPIMSPVYGFLVKSFWEIISEIIAIVDGYEYKDMLKFELGNWKLKENIKWPKNEIKESMTRKVVKFLKLSENKSSMLYRTLEIQYSLIFQMLTYFSPENYIVNRKYEYDFRVLEQDLSWWEKGLKMVRKKVGLAKRLQKLSTERLVWLCLLDHTIYEVFKDDPKYPILLKPYNSLFQGQISFIEKSSTDSHETFRVMTHSILKFITSTAQYFRTAQDKPGIDVEILVQQIWTFSTASHEIEQDPTTFSNFRDLIAEYNRYLSLRLLIDIEATAGHFSEQISHMMQTFMRIVATSLKKSVPTTTLVGYLRSLNDFLDDFKNIDFLAMWFVKREFADPNLLEKVDNKLSSGGNCSYRVTDVEKFVQVVQILGKEPIPRHHIIQVVSRLLECIETCINKQWQSRNVELQVTQLECTSLLLDATRKSFMYLKEQPDYLDFETFEKESIDPFVRLVRDCETFTDLKGRTIKVSESFWYIRKMDEIGIDRALEMFRSANSCHVSNKLLDCYNLYLENYDEYIAKYRSLVSDGKSHAEGLSEVVQVMNKTNPMHFSMWTEEFKTKEIPVMLAGLSAAWSILISKDVSSTGKFLKPHCIQILCVLRLLSVDLPNGADNHLAQVLTGQGKSVILGLLSAVLALTGHNVRVLCYSDYLSTRDQDDFDEFFQTFRLIEQIEYGTFKDMANSFVNPTINGRKSSLRKFVEERVMNHTSWPSVTVVPPASKNTVLLIDEVDVFFTDKFYGSGYFPCTCPGFQGLAKVQELIWTLAANNDSSEQIAQLSRKYIDDEVAARNADMLAFHAFLIKPGIFPLLEQGGDGYYIVKTYSNRSLFDEHLMRMINNAFSVRYYSWAQSNYAMTADGIISYKDKNGIYTPSSYCSYLNIFNYFRIKQSDYDTKCFRNYGYLNLGVGEISYARLPSQFQLILGVSGTLTNLGEYEKSGIKFYGIHNFSVLPSFFGESNLKFNKEADFHYFNEEQDWLKEIYGRTNSIVDSHRAVLIFFESDVTLCKFSKEYKTKFDRLNEITENTYGSVRDAYIDEAGLSCTVTLATRGMGRGVDYKSSLSVEKKGGVHVIQTFFSVDVKEEVQIKGRTARKDNKGTYELIICREHLVKDNIISLGDHNLHNYNSLEKIREELSVEKGKTVNEKIQKSEQNHNMTMKYFGLI